MIVRHEWFYFGVFYKCDSIREQDPWVWRRRTVDCIGCGAEVPGKLMASQQTDNEESQLELDRLWHEKYRPMAALACLVEEVNG